MRGRLDGKVALVTGAGGAIGAATVRRLAAEGARIVANDLARESAEAAIEPVVSTGRQAIAHVADHTSEVAVIAMMERVRDVFGGLDILVNNAFASFNDCEIADLEESDWHRTLNACLKGPFLCTKHAIPSLKARNGGSIVSISSVNALRAVSETAYTAAKGGLISMMRLVAADYAEFNIRSNVICPGTIATPASMGYWEQFPAGFKALRGMYPLARIGQPEDVSDAVLFLASDESRWITGTVQVVDGGLMAGKKLGVV